MAYSYIKEESADTLDCTFFSELKGQIYTVTFDPSLYSEFNEKLPTLIAHGYGVVFHRQQAIPKNAASREPDPQIMETIQQILHDFLENNNEETFLIYQCENYKEEKIFDAWYDKSLNSFPVIKGGVLLGVAGTKDISYLGFISRSTETPRVLKAYDELVAFSLEFL